MITNRREVLKGTAALVGQAATRTVGVGIGALVASCGGNGPGAQPPSALSYAGPVMARVGSVFAPLSPSVTGSVTSYSVSPALPAGLSLDGSSGVISGTPTAAAAAATYTITASNSGGSTTYTLSLQVLDKLTIASLSSANPTALTPLVLKTTGLNPSQTVDVSFNVGSITLAGILIRTSSDGSVVVTTPLWIDPATGKTASTSASVTIAQGSVTSNAVTLTINDMPSVASYGENPGIITRSVLNFMAISMGRSVNRYQAFSQVKAITTDTSSLQSALKAGVADAQVMRGNVDRLLVGAFPALVIGTAPTGETLQFDMSSVDVIDRILGLHLQALGLYPNTSFTDSASSGLVRSRAARHRQVRRSINAAGSTAEEIGTLAGAVGLLGSGVGALTPNTPTNTTVDRVVSGLNGLAGTVALGATVLDFPVVATAAVAAGVVLGAVIVGRDIYNIYTSPEGASGLDYAKTGLDIATTITGVFGAKAVGTGVVGAVTKALDTAGSTSAAADAIQIGGLIANLGSLSVGAAQAGQAVAMSARGQSPPIPIGDVDGTANVANSQGPILEGLSQINLTDPSSGTTFSSTCDVNGNYNLTVPLDASTINYVDMQLTTSDPVTGTVTSAPVPVDLSGLAPNATAQVPPVSGTCNDTDASNPDGDDPDCD